MYNIFHIRISLYNVLLEFLQCDIMKEKTLIAHLHVKNITNVARSDIIMYSIVDKNEANRKEGAICPYQAYGLCVLSESLTLI